MKVTKTKLFILLSIAFVLGAFTLIGTPELGLADHCISSATEATCTAQPDCAWESSTNSCSPTGGGGCGSYTDQTSCTSFSGCGWDTVSNTCYYSSGGTGSSCPIPGNDVCDYSACPSGCEWDTQGCVIGCYSGSSCSAGSYWDDATGTCVAGCESYLDESSCISQTNCYWYSDPSYNYCYYDSSGGGGIPGTSSCTLEASSCDYTACPSGCEWDANGCVIGCVVDAPFAYCGDGTCDLNESSYFCPADCSPSSPAWVNYTWTFTDGSTTSSILDRTDTEYLDYIALVDEECSVISINDFFWPSGAGDDSNWQAFGIPDCSGGTSTPPPTQPPSSGTKQIRGTVRYEDGVAVTDARVSMYQSNTNVYYEEATSSDGKYITTVTGGLWEVSIFPNSGSADWTYNLGPSSVVFASDDTVEEQVINFTISRSDARVRGIILQPDGTPPPENSVFVNFHSNTDFWSGATVEPNGSFRVQLAAGTYEVFIDVMDPAYSAPTIPSFTISSDQTLELGTLTLISSTKTITGTVTFPDGSPVTDANVDANNSVTGSWVHAETDITGNYTMTVTGGLWEAYVNPKSSPADWNYNQEPKPALFSEDTTPESKTLNFTVTTTDSSVTGKVLRPNGSVPLADTIFLDLISESDGSRFGSGLESDGTFLISVPAGTYSISIWSQDEKYGAPAVSAVTVVGGTTADVGIITLVEATKTITGSVTFPDGSPVTDASVGAYRSETQTWIETRTDVFGTYSLLLLGGSWEISVHPNSATPVWSHNQPPEFVVFSTDSVSESKVINFVVSSVDASITGKVLLPDGSSPLSNTVFVDFGSSAGFGFGGSVDSGGVFLVSLQAGTYNISVHSEDARLSAPDLPPVSVGTGETLDIGIVQLVKREDIIRGGVFDQSGKGIGGVEVTAWIPQGSGYTSARTDVSGAYELPVSPGKWEVFAFPDPSTPFFNPDPPKRVEVISGTPSLLNFVFQSADARISGSVVDKDGNILSNLYGHAELFDTTGSTGFNKGFAPGVGGPVERGQFSLTAPAGDYDLRVFLSPDSPYTALDSQPVTLVSGETVNVTVVVSENSSQITGQILDKNGSAVTGVNVQVFATSRQGAWQEAIVDQSAGTYTIKVSAGTWYLGYHIDPSAGYVSEAEDVEIIVGEDQTIVKNLVATRADSVLVGRITDPEGAGVPYVFVDVSRTSFTGDIDFQSFESSFVTGGETDQDGFYKIPLPAGTYYVNVFVRPDLGFIAPREKTISIAEGKTETLNLKLRRADLKISGEVFIGNTQVKNAFVWGWSENGGYQETSIGFDGLFRLPVSASDVWHIAAGAEIQGEFYKSNEISVSVADSDVVQNIVLERFEKLPDPVIETSDATTPTIVEVAGGVSVVAPANAVASSGSISISATADTRTPSQGETKVVGVAYDLEARDESGQTVSSFVADVTVTIPYDELELVELGTTEDELALSFWDETIGTWKVLKSSVVNKEENVVTATVDHFTRFAIVAAADITPPANPTDITATALGGGSIQLNWINPASDFDHAKVYRSEIQGELGVIRAIEAFGASYIDEKGLSDGEVYYYTVSAVDTAGNESSGADQISVISAGTSTSQEAEEELEFLPPTQAAPNALARNLRQGDQGDDVTALQQLLISEGVYPEALVTGYFGPLTQQAVIRFQEKYTAEVLAPFEITQGTGFVGPSTRAKINAILQLTGLSEAIPQAPGLEIASGRLSRNLKRGMSGDDVSTLQQLLISEGVYPEALVTGYFGPLTEFASIRFQEKYASEILEPLGLLGGTGFVGSSTRGKINQLLK